MKLLTKVCPICFEKIESDVLALECSHEFHEGCLFDYYLHIFCNSPHSLTLPKYNCPLCRRLLTCRMLSRLISNSYTKQASIYADLKAKLRFNRRRLQFCNIKQRVLNFLNLPHSHDTASSEMTREIRELEMVTVEHKKHLKVIGKMHWNFSACKCSYI
jgi:hypothetical protein